MVLLHRRRRDLPRRKGRDHRPHRFQDDAGDRCVDRFSIMDGADGVA